MMVNIPHAAFSGNHVGGGGSMGNWGARLALSIKNRLQSRFGASRMRTRFFRAVWSVETQVSNKGFVVCLTRSRYANNGWVLLIGSLNGPIRFGWPPRRTVIECNAELKQIAAEIHAFFEEQSDISALRWYFEGSGISASTPDTLSWA